MKNILLVAAVAVGASACTDYSTVVERTGNGLLAMRSSYQAVCTEEIARQPACSSWRKSFNTLQEVYSGVNAAIQAVYVPGDDLDAGSADSDAGAQ